MSSQNNSITNSDVLQIRYEKALKQIDKLIDINRELKSAVVTQEEKANVLI
jgi:hypothetical protein